MELSLWSKALQKLRDLIPQQQYSQWISPLQAQEKDNELVIFAPNKYLLDGVLQDYFQLIEQTIASVDNNAGTKLKIKVGNKDLMHGIEQQEEAVFDAKNQTGAPNSKTGSLSRKSKQSRNSSANNNGNIELQLDSFLPQNNNNPHTSNSPSRIEFDVPNNLVAEFTFDSFVEGKSNQLAKAAALQVGENPGKAYNPLFLYGGVGLGKTHLMHAIGNMILARKGKGGKVLYLHSERFVANMVRALQDNAISEFKKFYRQLDALLIDDIQFFAGKDRSQEEFFHTFNALLEGQQQIILTSDRYPKEITGIEERLKSRFGSGLTAAVEPPELETRVAILINKAKQCGVELPHEIAFFIAKKIRSNVRELEGALKRVIANSKFTGKEITIDFAQDALKDLLAVQDKLVSVDNIIRTVSEYYKIKVSDMLSKCRTRAFSRPRQVAMYICKELTEHSLPEIGDAFGKKDHTTVLHAYRQIDKMKKSSIDMSEDVQNLMKILTT